MSQAHNLVLSDPQNGLTELLAIPARYPDATDINVADWQASIIAWWAIPEKRMIIVNLIAKIQPIELVEVKKWTMRNRVNMPLATAKSLEEITKAITSVIP